MNNKEKREIRGKIKAAEQLKKEHLESRTLLDDLIEMYKEILRRE